MNYLETWYEALISPYGIIVRSTNPRATQSQLYQARLAALDPALEDLSIAVSPVDSNELWIIRRGKKAEDGLDETP